MKKRRIGRSTLLVALLACSFIGMLRWFEHHQVYHPSRALDATGAELGRPFENVFFNARDGVEINAWYFSADANSARGRLAVVVCHGNGGNISHRLDLYQTLLDCGVAVMAFDYRGYGRSQGRPGEEGTYLDGQAALHWLQNKGFAPKNIIVYGESLGGGVASELCLREETGGLILQSTFTSIPDIGAELYRWLPVRLISTIKYNTLHKLPRIHVPVLVMHSRNDGLIGFQHSQRNFAAANEPKLFWEINGEHNDPLLERTRFVAGVEEFLKRLEHSQVN